MAENGDVEDRMNNQMVIARGSLQQEFDFVSFEIYNIGYDIYLKCQLAK